MSRRPTCRIGCGTIAAARPRALAGAIGIPGHFASAKQTVSMKDPGKGELMNTPLLFGALRSAAFDFRTSTRFWGSISAQAVR